MENAKNPATKSTAKPVKPASVAKKELEETIVQTINNCGLPPFVISPVLSNALAQLYNLEAKQYEAEKAEYEKQLKEAEEKREKEKREHEEAERDALLCHAKKTMPAEERTEG